MVSLGAFSTSFLCTKSFASLPLANEVLGKVICYTCVSFCSQGGGGGSAQPPPPVGWPGADPTQTPWMQNPLDADPLPLDADPPECRPPGCRPPGIHQQEGGTNPTGMHSCSNVISQHTTKDTGPRSTWKIVLSLQAKKYNVILFHNLSRRSDLFIKMMTYRVEE